MIMRSFSVADPGFPRGGANLLFGQFSQKLHENEEILSRGRIPQAPPRSEADFHFLCMESNISVQF